MIQLSEIAEKINEILNGEGNPTPFLYRVETTGFHLDYIYDKNNNGNFIPVFISTLGGSINPVPQLKQVNLNVPLTFYFPVRFKENMFALYDWLIDVFSGKMLTYGASNKVALSNISVPTYGEIENVDLLQFKKWVDETFKFPISVAEPFISMQFTLYIQSSNNDYVYGNETKLKGVTFYQNNNGVWSTICEDLNPTNIEHITMQASEPASEQVFTDTYGKGYPANAAYTKQLPLIMKRTHPYRNLLNVIEAQKNPQSLVVKLIEEIPFINTTIEEGVEVIVPDPLKTTTYYFISNYSRRNQLGDLIGLQFTLSPVGDAFELPSEVI